MPPGSANASSVDPVAEDVAVLEDDVAEIDPNPKFDPALLGRSRLAIDHRPLQFGGTAYRVDDAREFRQHAVAGRFDDAARMLFDLRFDELAAMRLKPRMRVFLVRTHEARVPRHIGG
jgi:hypothetical protein